MNCCTKNGIFALVAATGTGTYDFELIKNILIEFQFIRILFGAPEPDPGHENQDPDPNKVGSDPAHLL